MRQKLDSLRKIKKKNIQRHFIQKSLGYSALDVKEISVYVYLESLTERVTHLMSQTPKEYPDRFSLSSPFP